MSDKKQWQRGKKGDEAMENWKQWKLGFEGSHCDINVRVTGGLCRAVFVVVFSLFLGVLVIPVLAEDRLIWDQSASGV